MLQVVRGQTEDFVRGKWTMLVEALEQELENTGRYENIDFERRRKTFGVGTIQPTHPVRLSSAW